MRLAICLAVLVVAPVSAQQLSRTERRVASAVDAGVPDAIALLERAVNINSGSHNHEGVRAVGALFRTEFERVGFTVRWVDGAAWGRAGHLIAEWRGGGRGPKVLFIGHLDTVFEQDSPFQRFERLNDSTVHGPGVMDMKGGNVVMLLALQALKAAGRLDELQVTVVLIGDEEDSGRPFSMSRGDLQAAADWADIAIGFEDGDGDPATAVVGRRGYSDWTLTVTGRPAHSSQVFREDIGYGAIYELARILTGMQSTLAGEPNLTFNPGLILGGTAITHDDVLARGTVFGKSNVVAEHAIAAGDLRTLSIEQRERTKQAMREIAGQHLPQTVAVIAFEDGYPPLAPTDGNYRLLAMLDQASRDLGYGSVTAVDPARAGAADISFVAGRLEMALDGVGLMGDFGHTVEEFADLRTLPMQAKRVAVLLHRLAR